MINFLQNPKSNCYVKGILHFLSVTDPQLFQLLTEGYYDTKRVDTPESRVIWLLQLLVYYCIVSVLSLIPLLTRGPENCSNQ